MEEKEFKSKNWDPKSVKWMFSYVKKSYGLFLLTVVFLLIADLLSSLAPYFFKLGIDEGISKKSTAPLTKYSIFLALSLTFGFIFSVLFNYLIQVLGQKMIYKIRMDVLNKIFSLGRPYFDKSLIGRLLTLLTNDVEAIKQFISDGVVGLFSSIVKITIISIILFYINEFLAIATLVSLPIFLIATWFFKRNLQKGYRGVRRSNSIMNTILVECITGIKEIILFNHKKKSTADFDASNKTYLKSYLNIVHSYSLYFPLIEVISSLSMLLVLLTVFFTISDSNISVGDIFAFFFYINMFFRPLRQLAEQFNTFQLAMSASERIHDFLAEDEYYENAEGNLVSQQGAIIEKNTEKSFDLSGDIEFKNVQFSYSKGKPVFKKLSFNVKRGETVAIVGSTGSGKSTIISLLNRLYEIDQGKILINKHDLKKVPIPVIRKNIATIPQDIFLFTGNFYENIGLANQTNETEIKEASKKVLLDNFVKKLPNKYEENVLEEGKSLSTGQKQLLAFARALIKDSPIIVLDEATANIDSETEDIIEKSLKQIIKGKTAIIIAHRLATIQNADKIIVLEKGKIVELGNHNQLLKKKGFYYQFYKIQRIQLNKK